MKKSRSYKILLFAIIFTMAAVSCTRSSALTTINMDNNGLAIKGYDPVAYFTMNAPVKGSAEHSFMWKGAEWRFASAEHLELFRSDPEKYAPQYGGY